MGRFPAWIEDSNKVEKVPQVGSFLLDVGLRIITHEEISLNTQIGQQGHFIFGTFGINVSTNWIRIILAESGTESTFSVGNDFGVEFIGRTEDL